MESEIFGKIKIENNKLKETSGNIIILTSGYKEHPMMKTDEEMKDAEPDEWPASFKDELEELKRRKMEECEKPKGGM